MRQHLRPSLAVASSLALVSVEALRWPLVQVLTPFLYPLLELFVWGTFAVAAVVSLINAVRLRSVKALAPQAAAFAVVIMVPWTSLTLWIDFNARRADREAVMASLKPGTKRLVRLQESLAHTSDGGEISVTAGGSVLFFTFRGVLDSFAGFVHGGASCEDFDGEDVQAKAVAPGWTWISCH